jgi:hypothetical protein
LRLLGRRRSFRRRRGALLASRTTGLAALLKRRNRRLARRRGRGRRARRKASRSELFLAQPRRFAGIAGRTPALPRIAQQIFTQLSQLLLSIEGFIGGLRLARLIGT